MKRIFSRIADFGRRAVDAVLPPRCVISGEEVDRQGMIAPSVWNRLEFLAAPHCAACGWPFEFAVEEGSLCAACLKRRPAFGMARSALKYNDASRDLILGFKHADKTHAVPAFVPWMRAAGREILPAADFLVPVPLHRLRLISRRYNQAALIAYALSKSAGVPVLPDALLRIRPTPPQGHMNIKERRRNVRRAFAVNPERAGQVAGKTIVLIDDVYTTGATVEECAKVLLKSGAGAVNVLTLARVVRG